MAAIVLGKAENGLVTLDLSRANRHGLVAGATGTGKTVTLQALAEQMAAAGSCVFVSDIKGDLSGIAAAGDSPSWVTERYQQCALPYTPKANKVVFWDVEGERGHPVRMTVSELGPQLLGRLLDLSDVQVGVLQVVFKVADDQGLLLLDLADLRAMLNYVVEEKDAINSRYGNVSTVSVSSIQRALLGLEQEGGAKLFGEPALQINDLLSQPGTIHVLDSVKLMQTPRVYAAFLLYLLSELFENLPEVGDLPVPKLCLFFDEAHLLFNDTPKALLTKIEQVVRLIRSKGVGVYFVTQQPSDVPESVLAQLGNRIQHALRAATPQGQKDIRVAATTMASNPNINTVEALPKLGVGEALISVLDSKGIPQPVEIVKVLPPLSRVAPLTDAERSQIMANSPMRGRYDALFDRVSAAEMLAQRVSTTQADSAKVKSSKASQNDSSALGMAGDMAKDVLLGNGRRQGLVEAAAKTMVRQMASQAGRALLRGLLGGLSKR